MQRPMAHVKLCSGADLVNFLSVCFHLCTDFGAGAAEQCQSPEAQASEPDASHL